MENNAGHIGLFFILVALFLGKEFIDLFKYMIHVLIVTKADRVGWSRAKVVPLV